MGERTVRSTGDKQGAFFFQRYIPEDIFGRKTDHNFLTEN